MAEKKHRRSSSNLRLCKHPAANGHKFVLTKRPNLLDLFLPIDGVVAQLVERLNGIQEVRGSNPLGSTIQGFQLWGCNSIKALRPICRGDVNEFVLSGKHIRHNSQPHPVHEICGCPDAVAGV